MASRAVSCIYCGAALECPRHAIEHQVRAHPEITARGRMVADSPEHGMTIQVWPLARGAEEGVKIARALGFYGDVGDS